MTELPLPLLWAAADPEEVAIVGDLVVVLAGAGLIALVARRIGLAVIPAYLVAGMALGPHALALVPAPEQLRPIGHLAIVVLLFGIGLELHLSTLRGRVAQLLTAAVLSCVLCVAAGWGHRPRLGIGLSTRPARRHGPLVVVHRGRPQVPRVAA